MKQINIGELKDREFDGYYWLSNEKKPRVLNGEDTTPVWDCFKEDINPFIVEAMLVDKKANKSYTIRNVDGKTLVYEYDLPKGEDATHTKMSFIANRMGTAGKLVFFQEWVKHKDRMCEGMEVMEPGALIFAGFEK